MATKKNLPIIKVKKAAVKKNPPVGGVKTPASKTVSVKKADKKNPPVIVSGERCFWVNNGAALSSMQDLRDALRTMSDEQFFHHTGMGRNDFSLWVLDVLGDKKCAAALLKAKDMKAAQSVVEKHLKTYSA